MKSKSLSLSDRKPWMALTFIGCFSLPMAFIFISAYKYSNAAIPVGLAFLGMAQIAWFSGSAIKTLSARIELLEKAKEEAEDTMRPQA